FLGVEVGAAFGGVAQLDDGHDVQRWVDPSVAGAGESMPGLLSGGGVQRGGAVRDANLSRSANRWMSPTSTSSRAAPEGPIPVRSIRVDPRARATSARRGVA